jgi:hypothetical protein
MHRNNRPSIRLSLVTAFAALVAVVSGCAESVGDIDRTQPNLIHKSVFQGEWFVRQTVIDVPATSYHSFVGMTGEMDMIRWEIQEDMLIGYRSYEFVPGSDSNADHSGSGVNEQPVKPGQGEGRDPEAYKENPVIAYPIVGHVDVQRDYNPRTGEQTNVISENTFDRPWYEREYLRVDWSSPQVQNWTFLRGASDSEFTASYWVQPNEGGADAPRLERDEDGVVNYFDVTERLFVEPYRECILFYNGGAGDCTGSEVKYRTSFLKVDAERERQYEPQVYDDNRMGEFGYFRTERNTYDRKRGVTWTGKIFLANKHDIWQSSYDGVDENGDPKPLPYAQRQLRPIVYTLSPNYPADMIPITMEIGKEWDRVFKETAAAARGQSVEQLTADLTTQTGRDCLYCVDLNESGEARIGDLRYNFIYWVDSPQLSSPLGYGPSQAHPETGRIVSANAFMYGASVDSYAEYALDIVKLLNGDLSEVDASIGQYISDAVASRRPAVDPRSLEKFEGMRLNDPYFERQLLGWDRVADLNKMVGHELPAARPGYADAQLEKIRGTALETQLINDEIILAMGQGEFQPGDALTEDFVKKASPASWASPEDAAREDERRSLAERNSIWLADFSDGNTLGLAKEMKNKMETEGWDYDKVYQYLREQIYLGVSLHEVGHTVGLRHNFGGSADPLNYFDEYWPLRQETSFVLNKESLTMDDILKFNCAVVTAENETACNKQTDQKMAEYQYSTIMDYGGRFNSDFHGLGKYDRAAIASAYVNLTEVFDEDAVAKMAGGLPDVLRTVGQYTNPLYGSLTENIDYGMLPAYFGGAENMTKRHWVPRAEYEAAFEVNPATAPLKVPYYACYDEYRDATPYCHTWDQGADEFEITRNYIDYYNAYFVFDYFQRDRVGYNPVGTYNKILSRYFMPIQGMYQQWVFDRIYGSFKENSFRFAYATLAMQQGFETLWNALGTPAYGSYTKDPATKAYRLTSLEQTADADLYIPPGIGKRTYTRYDYESGYYLFDRVLEPGAFWTQLAALNAIVSSQSRLSIGQDGAADVRAFSIPYYLAFQNEVDNLFGSVIQEDSKFFAPQVVKGQMVPRTLESAGAEDDAEVDGFVELDIQFSTKIYAMLYGSALLSVNYDLSFVQATQVALEGSGEVLTPGEGFTTVSFAHPKSGRIYSAYKPTTPDGHRWIAAEIIDQLNLIKLGSDQNKDFLMDGKVQDLEIMRGMYKAFGSAF